MYERLYNEQKTMDIIGDTVYLEPHETAIGYGVPNEFPVTEAAQKAELLYVFAKRLIMHAESLGKNESDSEAMSYAERAERMSGLSEALIKVSSPQEIAHRKYIGKGIVSAEAFANNAGL